VLGSSPASDGIQTVAKAPLVKNPAPATPSEQPKFNNPAPGLQWGAAVGPVTPQGMPGGEQPNVNASVTQWGSCSQSSEQPGAKPNTAAPSIPWGNAPGAAPVPSYLWVRVPHSKSSEEIFPRFPACDRFQRGYLGMQSRSRALVTGSSVLL